MNNPAPTAAATLEAGMPAPDFTLPADGNRTLQLSSLNGKNVVLYFYPKDDTPGCTIEAKEFGDAEQQFAALDTVIIGISKDDVKSHDKFKEKHCLPFTLVSDSDGAVCAAYGTWIEKSMYGKKYMGIDRATFLIGKDGVIARVWRKVSVTNHVKQVLEAAGGLER
jgi:peroxiredoxin Q/BCP